MFSFLQICGMGSEEKGFIYNSQYTLNKNRNKWGAEYKGESGNLYHDIEAQRLRRCKKFLWPFSVKYLLSQD